MTNFHTEPCISSTTDRGGGGGGGGGEGGGGNRGSLPWAPSVRGPPNSAETCSGFRSQSMTNGYGSGLRSLVT